MDAEPLAHFRGRLVPASQARLGFWDAGFVFGATVTDFCRTRGGTLHRWPDHVERLFRDAASIGITPPLSPAELGQVAESLLAANLDRLPPGERAVITFLTPGPVPHLVPPGVCESGPTLGMHAFPLPVERYRALVEAGAVLAAVGPHPQGGLVDPRVKHRSRLMWWQAGRLVPEGALAVPLLPDGTLTETALASVLVSLDGRTLCVPPAGTILDGVGLREVREIAATLGIPVEERPLSWAACEAGAAEALLAAAAFGVAPVRRLGARELPVPGPLAARLMAAVTPP